MSIECSDPGSRSFLSSFQVEVPIKFSVSLKQPDSSIRRFVWISWSLKVCILLLEAELLITWDSYPGLPYSPLKS